MNQIDLYVCGCFYPPPRNAQEVFRHVYADKGIFAQLFETNTELLIPSVILLEDLDRSQCPSTQDAPQQRQTDAQPTVGELELRIGAHHTRLRPCEKVTTLAERNRVRGQAALPGQKSRMSPLTV